MLKDNGNQKIAEFGKGDIRITSGIIYGLPVLGLNSHKPHEIGSLAETQTTVETLQKSEIYMTFESVKSLEVLILKLQEARSMFLYGTDRDFDYPSNITDIYEENPFIKG